MLILEGVHVFCMRSRLFDIGDLCQVVRLGKVFGRIRKEAPEIQIIGWHTSHKDQTYLKAVIEKLGDIYNPIAFNYCVEGKYCSSPSDAIRAVDTYDVGRELISIIL